MTFIFLCNVFAGMVVLPAKARTLFFIELPINVLITLPDGKGPRLGGGAAQYSKGGWRSGPITAGTEVLNIAAGGESISAALLFLTSRRTAVGGSRRLYLFYLFLNLFIIHLFLSIFFLYDATPKTTTMRVCRLSLVILLSAAVHSEYVSISFSLRVRLE